MKTFRFTRVVGARRFSWAPERRTVIAGEYPRHDPLPGALSLPRMGHRRAPAIVARPCSLSRSRLQTFAVFQPDALRHVEPKSLMMPWRVDLDDGNPFFMACPSCKLVRVWPLDGPPERLQIVACYCCHHCGAEWFVELHDGNADRIVLTTLGVQE